MFGEKKLDLTLEDDVQPVARHPFDQDEPACSSVEEPTRRKDQVHVIGLQLLPDRQTEGWEARLGRLSPALLGAALGVLILFVAATVPSQGVPPFIYFRF